jgi:hypothetical protein
MAANDPEFKIEHDQAEAKALRATSGDGPQKHARFKLHVTNGTFAGDFSNARDRADVEASWHRRRSDDMPPKPYPQLTEADDAKRTAGFKAFDRWQVGEGCTIPLVLGLATIVHRKSLRFTP